MGRDRHAQEPGGSGGHAGEQALVTVDDLKIAQFVYLLLDNRNIRDVIDAIGSKGSLILGRFSAERKAVLDALRAALRERGFVPIVFDFERPQQRDLTETVLTLAGMSLFVIADITNPRSAPLELQASVPDYMIPFVPIIAEGEEPFAIFRDLQVKYGQWVLQPLEYDSVAGLVAALDKGIIEPALERHKMLAALRATESATRHVRQFLK